MVQTVVITGANRGIGFELCRQYVEAGANVFALCRSSSSELSAIGGNIIEGVDVSDPQSVALAADKLKAESIDILINNAGILRNEYLADIDFDTVLEQFAVNTLGPLRMTKALLPLMVSGSKVAMITSRMGSIADNTSGGYYGYRMSKAALNALSMSLANDLESKGIAVAVLHPGFVQTDMVGFAGDVSAADAAGRLIQRISGLNLDNSGTFWHANGEVLPW